MTLDRVIRKAVVIPASGDDPSVGAEYLALYNSDGTPLIINEDVSALPELTADGMGWIRQGGALVAVDLATQDEITVPHVKVEEGSQSYSTGSLISWNGTLFEENGDMWASGAPTLLKAARSGLHICTLFIQWAASSTSGGYRGFFMQDEPSGWQDIASTRIPNVWSGHTTVISGVGVTRLGVGQAIRIGVISTPSPWTVEKAQASLTWLSD